MPTQPPAATIGKYQILHLVGEGAMGAVYRALDPVLQRPVAIKVMSDAVAREQELRERFLREAQAAGSLQHPNVVTVYDFGEVDGHLYIAMEFLDGEDLEALLARDAGLPLPAKLGIAVDVLSGLSYAHRRGIVHRDIKPANIRVTEDERAKIMDFGVAHLTSQKMTRTGMTMGTPNYMAPEQVTAGPIGAHTDVFSMGAVLYELLTRKKPFAADTLHAVLYRIVSEPTPAPSSLVPSLPPELDEIVARSLAKDPAQRYQSAADMANDLNALRATLITGARAASASVSLNARLSATLPAPDAGAPAATVPPGAPARAGAGRGALLATGAVAAVAIGVGGWALLGRDAASGGPARPPAATAPAVTAPAATPAPDAPAPNAAAPAVTPPVPQTAPQTAPQAAPAAPAAPAARPRPEPEPTRRPAAIASAAAPAASTTPAVPPPAAPASEPAREVTPPPAAAAAADASAEIGEAVSRYARAISARDLAAVRAAFPGITGAQAQNFERLFGSVRELRASFAVSELAVDGATADGRLAGAYEIVTSAGQRQRLPVSLQASFRRSGDAWVLSAVR